MKELERGFPGKGAHSEKENLQEKVKLSDTREKELVRLPHETPKFSLTGEAKIGLTKESKMVIDEKPETKSYRLKGVLEQQDPSIEPLPATPITPDAKDRLKTWGMDEKMIEKLQDFTSSFRYDLVPQRAEKIAERGGYIYENPDGTEEVVLPDALNLKDRLDGHCGDLATQYLTQLYSSGFIQEINNTLQEQGKSPIVPCFFEGSSRTHFNTLEHQWNGFFREEDEMDVISIDPSFQEISDIKTNGYSPRKIYRNPTTVDALTAETIQIMEVSVHNNGISATNKDSKMNTLVLGSSSDKELVYDVGFVKNVENQAVVPIVLAQPSDGSSSDRPRCVTDASGKLCLFDKHSMLTNTQRNEMIEIYQNLARISLQKDQRAAQEAKDKIIAFKLQA